MITGIKAQLLKTSKIPKGWLTVQQFARALDRVRNTVYHGIKAGKVPTDLMRYWYDPDSKKEILILREEAVGIYEKNTRIRKRAVLKGGELTPEHIEDLKKTYGEGYKPPEDPILKNPGDGQNTVASSYQPSDPSVQSVPNAADSKNLLASIKVQKEQLELQKAKNQVVNFDRVKNLIIDMTGGIKQRLIASIPRIVAELPGDKHKNTQLLEAEFNELLKSLISPEELI